MTKDSTVQILINSELKTQVEALYRSIGTSFAEAVRIFAQQSILEDGMPFRPALNPWDELTREEIDAKLSKSIGDIDAGRVFSQSEMNSKIGERFSNGRHTEI